MAGENRQRASGRLRKLTDIRRVVVKSIYDPRAPYPIWKDASVAVLRALRSLLIIGGVALVIGAVFNGGLSWSNVVHLAAVNRTVFVAVFLGLCVWEFWYRRAKRTHSIES